MNYTITTAWLQAHGYSATLHALRAEQGAETASRCASSASCDTSCWRRLTADNSSPRRVIVADAWSKSGLGNLLPGIAMWLTFLLRAAPDRSVRFAWCVPRRVHETPRWRLGRGMGMPVCNERAYATAAMHRGVESALRFDGLHNLAAEAEEWAAAHVLLRRPFVSQGDSALAVDGHVDGGVVAATAPAAAPCSRGQRARRCARCCTAPSGSSSSTMRTSRRCADA